MPVAASNTIPPPSKPASGSSVAPLRPQPGSSVGQSEATRTVRCSNDARPQPGAERGEAGDHLANYGRARGSFGHKNFTNPIHAIPATPQQLFFCLHQNILFFEVFFFFPLLVLIERLHQQFQFYLYLFDK